MKEYHKIQTVYKRDERTHKIIEGDFSLPEFKYLKDAEWVFTEKVDGTNIRVIWDGSNVTFGGRTDNAQIPAFLVNRLHDLFLVPDRIALFPEVFSEADDPVRVCLYGEGYGARIQKGGGNYKTDGVDFVLFDVKIGDWWLLRESVEEIASRFGLDVVPIVGRGSLIDMVQMARQGIVSRWGTKPFAAEGLVGRPAMELRTRRGDRIIAKIKTRDFQG